MVLSSPLFSIPPVLIIKMKMTLETIKVSKETKYKFDKLQLELKNKELLKTQDDLVKLLLKKYKESK
jgi:hypothetical protein